MKPLNLLIVSRFYWPYSGLAELAIIDLAKNFSDAGHSVTVATLKWERNWSDVVSFRDIPVIRFSRPVAGPWTSFRYARSLSRHFGSKTFDGVIVTGIGDEAQAVINYMDESTPVFIALDDSLDGVKGSIHRKHIETCLAADGIVANSQTVKDHLDSFSEMPKTHVIHPGLPFQNSYGVSKTMARNGLSKAHPVTRIENDQKLVICGTKMQNDDGVLDLLAAWPRVLSVFPGAKLWLLGEGPNTNRIWQKAVEMDLSYSVVFPGFFDNWNDLLIAADLYVHTAGPSQSADGLIRAHSSGLASIAVSNRVTKRLIEHEIGGWLTPEGCNLSMANSLIHALSNPEHSREIGLSGKAMLPDIYSPAFQVNQFVDLIAQYSNQMFEVAK